MSKTKTGSNAQFTGTGKGLTTVGNHCYGYSGVFSVDDNEKTLLQFNTGKHYIKAQIQFNYVSSANQDYTYKVYFNGIIVQQYNVGNSVIYTSPDNFLNVIIPPLTEVKLASRNIIDSTALDQIVSLTGEIYG
jgi:hypothetical protein